MHQQTLCEAIKDRKNVSVLYDDDYVPRIFSPYIVFTSSRDNVLVAGYQVVNPAELTESNEWRRLDLGKIRSVTLTENNFTPDIAFDPFSKRYGNRIICHVKQKFQ